MYFFFALSDNSQLLKSSENKVVVRLVVNFNFFPNFFLCPRILFFFNKLFKMSGKRKKGKKKKKTRVQNLSSIFLKVISLVKKRSYFWSYFEAIFFIKEITFKILSYFFIKEITFKKKSYFKLFFLLKKLPLKKKAI